MPHNVRIAIQVVAWAHVVFALAEMLFWQKATPLLIYKGLGPDLARKQADATALLGRNMGLYNGILAACLFWLLANHGLTNDQLYSLGSLLLASVIVAGIFGGITIKWTISIFQAIPAAVALFFLWR